MFEGRCDDTVIETLGENLSGPEIEIVVEEQTGQGQDLVLGCEKALDVGQLEDSELLFLVVELTVDTRQLHPVLFLGVELDELVEDVHDLLVFPNLVVENPQ